MPLRQRHAAQSRGVDGGSPGQKRDLAQTRRNIVDRRSRRVERIVGCGQAGRQAHPDRSGRQCDRARTIAFRRGRVAARREDALRPSTTGRVRTRPPGAAFGRLRHRDERQNEVAAGEGLEVEPFLARPDRRNGRGFDQAKNPRGDAVGQGQDALANRGVIELRGLSQRQDRREAPEQPGERRAVAQGLRGKASKRSVSWAGWPASPGRGRVPSARAGSAPRRPGEASRRTSDRVLRDDGARTCGRILVLPMPVAP